MSCGVRYGPILYNRAGLRQYIDNFGRNERRCTVRHLHQAKDQICLRSLQPDPSLRCQSEDILITKHAYSNMLKILPSKNKKNQIKILIFFTFLLKNIDCGYRLELPQYSTSTYNLCFWAEIRKNCIYPCKPQFYYIKVGLKAVIII